MNPLHVTLSVGPLAVYLLLLGLLNLARRPFLTTGARDIYALGIGLSGFFVIGPMSLFMPEAAARVFGGYIWLMLIVFYLLCLTLFVLMLRPRLVIYNTNTDQVRPLLANLIKRLDLDHQWAGESLSLSDLGVQLQMDKTLLSRSVSLVATAADQNFGGWRRLERELAEELRSIEVRRNPIGMLMVTGSVTVLAGSLVWIVNRRPEVAQGLADLLRL